VADGRVYNALRFLLRNPPMDTFTLQKARLLFSRFDMTDSDQSIAVLTIPDISEYSPERVNHGICSKLVPEFEVTLIGPVKISERIQSTFNIEPIVKRSHQNKWLQRVLLVPLTIYLVLKHVRQERPDVVASFGNLPINGLVCALVSKISSPVSVVRVTSDFTNLWRYQTGIPATVACFIKNNVLGMAAVRLADAVIVLGPVMKNKLEQRGIDESKLWAIPQPLHIEAEDSTSSKDVRSELDIPEKAPVVLFVGYFKQSKGPKRLVRTTEYLMERDSDIHVVIVGGSGEYEEYVQQTLGEYDRVHLTGWVPHEHLPAYFRTADVLLHPSNSEGLPNVVLEALYFELPVVATDSGGEVPVYVSNIGSDYQELGEIILNGEFVTDPCPDHVRSPENGYLYRQLFESVISSESR